MLRQPGPALHDMMVENCAFEELDDAFKRFVEFWYRHRGPDGAVPPIDAFDEPDAPLMWMGGGVLAADLDSDGRENFRFRYAADDISEHACMKVEGRSYADLMDERAAAENVAQCGQILRSDRPHYLQVRSRIHGSKYVLKRLLAAFGDEHRQPTYLAGLWRLVGV